MKLRVLIATTVVIAALGGLVTRGSAQEPVAPPWMNFQLRTAQEPAALAAAATAAARSVTKDAVIRYVRTMEQQVNASLIRERLLASLSVTFALLALILVAVGLYGGGVVARRCLQAARLWRARMGNGRCIHCPGG